MMIHPFKHKIWLSSPTMHGDELKYVTEAYETNWMSTVGKNINEVERLIAEKVGVRYASGIIGRNEISPSCHEAYRGSHVWSAGNWKSSAEQ